MPFSQTAQLYWQEEKKNLVPWLNAQAELIEDKTWKWNMFTNRCHVMYDQFLPCKNHLVQLDWFLVLCKETKSEIPHVVFNPTFGMG